MARLVIPLCDLSAKSSSKRGLFKYSSRRVLVAITLVFVLMICTAALAQPRRGREQAIEPLPPRPQPVYKPWPWFIAFILLGLAWYPAFKNSKRELNE